MPHPAQRMLNNEFAVPHCGHVCDVKRCTPAETEVTSGASAGDVVTALGVGAFRGAPHWGQRES
ncbi:MAG: hypothetical protein ACK5GU_08580 [Chloroflexota bacterium]|jgi:hypothetical protein